MSYYIYKQTGPGRFEHISTVEDMTMGHAMVDGLNQNLANATVEFVLQNEDGDQVCEGDPEEDLPLIPLR